MKKCKNSSCAKNVKKLRRGFCEPCYRSYMKHDDPNVKGKRGRENKTMPEIKRLLGLPETDCCIPWRYGCNKSGYPILGVDGVTRTATSFLLELCVGHKPDDKDEAAHTCGMRTCMNKKHLYWATYEENNKDKIEQGTYNKRGWHNGLPPGPERDALRKQYYGT